MLLLNNDDVRRSISMEECIEAIEEALVEEGRGWAMSDNRVDRHSPTGPQEAAESVGMTPAAYRHMLLNERMAADAHVEPEVFDVPWAHMFKTMYGTLHKRHVSAVRVSSETMAMPVIDGKKRIAKLPTGPGGRYTSLVQLFDTRAGHLTCIMPDGYIQRNRVVATGAVGTKHLARRGAERIGLLGTGMMADGAIEATRLVLDLKQVKVFSPTAQHRREFVARWREEGVSIVEASSVEDAIADVDVILSCTNSRSVLVRPEHLKPGMHVNTLTFFDVDRAAIDKCDRVLASWHMVDAGGWICHEYELPATHSEAKLFASDTEWLHKLLANPDTPTLGGLTAGKIPGRTDDRQITCHMNTSSGLQFAALGARIQANARKMGLGREIPDDWFLQELHP